MIKKMKILETLDHDESKSEKLLIKLNAFDKRIEENRSIHSEMNNKLSAAINSNNTTEMNTLTNQLLESQENFHRLTMEKNRDIRTLLTEVEFAKYLNFENRFMKEFFNSCVGEKNKKRDGNTKNNEPREKSNTKKEPGESKKQHKKK